MVTHLVDGWRNEFGLLATQVAVFTGMRIESTHDNLRRRDTELVPEVCVQDLEHVLQVLRGQVVGHLAQWHVRAGQGDAQVAGNEHHDGKWRSGCLGKVLGVPNKPDAAVGNHTL